MAALSRRAFLTTTAALAAAAGLERAPLGRTLSLATAADPDTRTTLGATILHGPVVSGRYRRLRTGPGEPYLPRLDVLRKAPDPARTARRRSLLYLGHLSDLHVIDAQSPGRIEPMIVQDHASWASAFHPQDPVSAHTTSAMVAAFSDARRSPLTGAAMGAAVVTGDSADMHSALELRWYIDLLDGRAVDPASSGASYEGVQAWPEATWAYRPGDPSGGDFGDYGFPRLPDLLADAVREQVPSVGLPAPWYAVHGNHDTLLLGTFGLTPSLRALAVGGQKAWTLEATASTALAGYVAATSPLQQALDALSLDRGRPGFRSVTANPARRLFAERDFMAEHFRTTSAPGPVGHGFTQHNLDTGETWWAADLTPQVRLLGIDTCSSVAGPDGAVPGTQLRWLETQLQRATAERRMCLLLSHHNSLTLENRAQRPGDDETLHGADELVALLLRYPVAVAWLNGHTHLNQILAHTSATSGFWEVTTASCVDFPQQQQVLELVDNRDGSMSIFTTVLDHAAPVAPGGTGGYLDLAAQGRELAANDWVATPAMRRGSPLDRNTELLLPAPFALDAVTDAELEAQQLTARTRLLAYERARGL